MVCCKFIDLYKTLNDKAWSQKKVTRVDDHDDSLLVILKVIDAINSLDEFAVSLWDNRMLDELNIPSEFAEMVMPSAVRYEALNLRTKDILIKPEFDMNELPSYEMFIKACDKFRSRFKKDGFTDMTSVGNLRKAMNLNDVIAKASFNGAVNSQANPFIPIPLHDVGLFEDRYFNDTYEKSINDWITKIRFV